MIENVFSGLTFEELKVLYAGILEAREEGIRPRILDEYIRQIKEKYPLSFGEAWRYTEQLFWEEIAKRFFDNK